MASKRKSSPSLARAELQAAAIAYANARHDVADDPQSYKYERRLADAWVMLEAKARAYTEVTTDGE